MNKVLFFISILLTTNCNFLVAQEDRNWDPPVDSANILNEDTTFRGDTYNYMECNPHNEHITFGNVNLRKYPLKDGKWLFLNNKEETIGVGHYKKGKKHGMWSVIDGGLSIRKYRRGKVVSGKSITW